MKIRFFLYLLLLRDEYNRERIKKIQDERDIPDFVTESPAPNVGETMTFRAHLRSFVEEGRCVSLDQDGNIIIIAKVYKVISNSVYAFIESLNVKERKNSSKMPTH
jgi:hypothetical protein